MKTTMARPIKNIMVVNFNGWWNLAIEKAETGVKFLSDDILINGVKPDGFYTLGSWASLMHKISCIDVQGQVIGRVVENEPDRWSGEKYRKEIA